MSKKPWEEKVADTEDNQDEMTRTSKENTIISTPILTILLSLFVLIIIGVLFFVFYTSNGGSNEQKATSGFYGSSKTTKKNNNNNNKTSAQSSQENQETTVSESTEATTSETTTSSSDEDGKNTITVEGGEGAAGIAARAGISVDKLYELNPDHMTQGYWYANPGDKIKIK
ncbi:SAG1386/EF1546 family surface-associated protein [Streptococcus macacae]|uniref:LysM domain protein n=1 Tax=Streptococcus macacae NCTC 11558 TaxID=764298 RepID=G5JZ05_9STRE|nr:SAG1386/EF1546 family surface-associated protein [Streptococcus macacae]EHJ51615.1 LysM domain protein [Streptococcus macacae NCTC 11558]SUN78260.1 membrane protein [Streptococcus macacae NCTC 11558]